MNAEPQSTRRESVRHAVPAGARARPHRGHDGFTLVELVIALAVFAILLNFAAPSFRDTIARLEQGGLYNRLVSDLHLARAEGIRRGARVRVCPRADAGTCGQNWIEGWHVYVESGGDATQIDAGEEILRTRPPLRAGDFSVDATATVLPAANAIASGIVFDSRGRPDWTLGTFVLCDARGVTGALALIVNGAGSLRRGSESDTSDGIVVDALGDPVTCPA